MEVAVEVYGVLPAVRVSELRDLLDMPDVLPLPFLPAAIGRGWQLEGLLRQVLGSIEVAPVGPFTREELGSPDAHPNALVLIGHEGLLLNLLVTRLLPALRWLEGIILVLLVATVAAIKERMLEELWGRLVQELARGT